MAVLAVAETGGNAYPYRHRTGTAKLAIKRIGVEVSGPITEPPYHLLGMTVQRTLTIGWPPSTSGSTAAPPEAADIRIHDDFLDRDEQTKLFEFLSGPGWAFGAYSDPTAGASRYWFKHFAGIIRDAREQNDTRAFEEQLGCGAPLVSNMWARLRSTILKDHQLVRCYANGYPSGAEGGLHTDSDVPNHFTTIYYPHLAWHPNFGGETLFFTNDGADILRAVFPKPNRLVVFPGTIPHVARGVSRVCPQLRITLMFKSSKWSSPMLEAAPQPSGRPG